MKFLYFTLILSALFMIFAQVDAKCTATKCKCTGIPNGLFCGDGVYGCKKGYVYQCDGHGKKSCEYGKRDSCK